MNSRHHFTVFYSFNTLLILWFIVKLEFPLRSDKLIVTKLDLIARTATSGFETVKELLDRGVAVHVLNMGLIDNTPTGRLILIMLSFAEFEREMIKERTAAGKAIARQKPGYKEGRPKQITPEIIKQIKKGVSWEELRISRATWYRYK